MNDDYLVLWGAGCVAVFFLLRWLAQGYGRGPTRSGPRDPEIMKVAGWALFAGIALIAVAGYQGADEIGWIPHTYSAGVSYPNDGWEVGEYVNCTISIATGQRALMDCSGSTVVTYTFWISSGIF